MWNWNASRRLVSSLRGRLGFPDEDFLEFIGLNISLKDGRVRDLFTGQEIRGQDIYSKNVLQSIFYVLSGYAKVKDVQQVNELISSRQIRGSKFIGRENDGAKARLLSVFSDDPDALVNASSHLKGKRRDFPYGDVAVEVPVLPFVPLMIVLTVSDTEFPCDVRIFYDKSIETVFDSEQINFLTQLSVSRLIDARRMMEK